MRIGRSPCRRYPAFLLALLPLLAWAFEGQYNSDGKGRAIHGYDAVAYFTVGQPTPGDPQLSYRWSGVDWLFADAENRRLFMADPRRYAPQYGGFCAYAASLGRFADGDPTAWSIIDDKLYLNFSQQVRRSWLPRAAEFIRDADALWPSMDAANP